MYSKPQALLTFIVGKEKEEQTFVIHKDFATFYSQLFKDAFNEKSKSVEAETLKMKLPYSSPSDFGIVVHWLYTNKIVQERRNNFLCMNWQYSGDWLINSNL